MPPNTQQRWGRMNRREHELSHRPRNWSLGFSSKRRAWRSCSNDINSLTERRLLPQTQLRHLFHIKNLAKRAENRRETPKPVSSTVIQHFHPQISPIAVDGAEIPYILHHFYTPFLSLFHSLSFLDSIFSFGHFRFLCSVFLFSFVHFPSYCPFLFVLPPYAMFFSSFQPYFPVRYKLYKIRTCYICDLQKYKPRTMMWMKTITNHHCYQIFKP